MMPFGLLALRYQALGAFPLHGSRTSLLAAATDGGRAAGGNRKTSRGLSGLLGLVGVDSVARNRAGARDLVNASLNKCGAAMCAS